MPYYFPTPSTTEIYTLSLHDALPIWLVWGEAFQNTLLRHIHVTLGLRHPWLRTVLESLTWMRSEEHTSELQSRPHLVCRLLLEKKNPAPSPLLCRLAADSIPQIGRAL